MIRKVLPTVAFAGIIALGAVIPAAEVPLPSTLSPLLDDPGDPGNDPDAFITSPSGRFRFSEFVFSPVAVGTTPPGDTDIRVSMSEAGNSVTLVFDILSNGAVEGPDAAYELELEYRADVIDPSLSFISHSLSMDADVSASNGSVFINEQILVPGGGGIGSVTTFAGVSDQADILLDMLQFSPTRTMTVHNKDISVVAGLDGTASLTRIEQTFQAIPEPSSLVLLGLALVGLGLTKRRFHRI